MNLFDRFNKLVWALCLVAVASMASAQVQAESVAEFSLSVVGQHLDRAENVIRVKHGDQVRLHWRSDHAIKLHLHGYDIEQTVTDSAPVTMSFEAFATGRFSVNLHQIGQRKGGHHGNVLLYLEVMPR